MYFKYTDMLIFLILLIPFVGTCGVVTHNVIADRAHYWLTNNEYSGLISRYPKTFQAGAAFPDWGYNCVIPGYSKASEIAHWFPFQRAAIKYLHTNYPRPWNTSAEQLIVFILGIVSHSVSDVIWHNLILKTGQGFIQAMANSDYNAHGHGYNRETHDDADFGGEFVAAYEVDLTFIYSEWKLPIIDIINIYRTFGYHNITYDDLAICVDELYTEMISIRDLPSEYIYPYYAAKSRFLVSEYQDWWFGGINDMAAWVDICWGSTIAMIANSSLISRCRILSSGVGQSRVRSSWKSSKYLQIKMPKSSFAECSQNIGTKLSGLDKLSFFGQSLAKGDINGDGIEDLIIGAPGYNQQRGMIQIVYANTTTNHYHSGHPNSRFGYAIESLDINLDGYDDVIVGIPSHGSNTLDYTGLVEIYYGSINGISSHANMTISCDTKYANLGISFNKGDIDGDGFDDLLIGLPYYPNTGLESGCLLVVLAGPYYDGFHIITCSTNFWSWFGFASQVFEFNNTRYLLVNQQLFNNGNASIGRLNCFNITNYRSPVLTWSLMGVSDDFNDRFGIDFVLNDTTLFISAPSSVYIVSIAEIFSLQKRNISIASLNTIQVISKYDYTQFGLSLLIHKDKLIISEPYADFEAGKVHIYKYRNGIYRHTHCYSPFRYRTLFGRTLLTLNNYLAVGAPRDRGEVTLIPLE